MSKQNSKSQPINYDVTGINLKALGLKAPSQSKAPITVIPPGITATATHIPFETTSIGDVCAPSTLEESKVIFDPTFQHKYSTSELETISKNRLNAIEKLPEVTIDSLQFSLLKRKVIQKFTIIDNLNDTGSGSINDPKLGPSKGSENCATCFQDSLRCPGHFGRIPLQEKSDDGWIVDAPIIDPFYRREIISLLSVFCNSCGACLVTEASIKELGLEKYKSLKSRLKIIEEYVKGQKEVVHTRRKSTNDVESLNLPAGVTLGPESKCDPNPKYVLDKGANSHKIEYKTDTDKFERTIDDIIKIFNKVTAEDAKLVGLGDNMPIDFILYDCIVMPPNIRGASLYETENESDRMAATYREIIKSVNALKTNTFKKKSGESIYAAKEEQKKYIYNHVKNLIDNRDVKAVKGVNQASAHGLLQGKEGLIRASIMARRSDITGRTVISPDPTLEFGEMSVPMEWASVLTVPVTVCDVNIAVMNKLLQSGKITHITKGSGPRKGLRSKVTESNYANFVLEFGDRVDRWLQNGDYLTLNRMPSLHKQSIMTGKVKLWNHRTLGLHLSYTTPYNADHDGDEMNVHTPQTFDALAEAISLMTMEMCMPNEQNNSTFMGLVMDAVIGVGLLTMEDEVMDIVDWNDYLMMLTARDDLGTLDERLLEMGVKKYTGKALFSALLPADLNYDIKGIVIKKGILIDGFITKDHVGPTAGSIQQAMYNNPVINGPSKLEGLHRAGKFITDATRVMGAFIVKRGFSVGLRDCGFGLVNLEKMKKESLLKLGIQTSQIGERFTSYGESQKKEQEIVTLTSGARNNLGEEIYNELPYENAFKVMITTKSKGTKHNFTQIAVMIGQQMFAGKRMASQMSGGRRTLPHFLMDDDSLEAKGLVESSYIEGLSAIEYFFHAYGSREGLVISAVDISKIGMAHREMSTMLQDCRAGYDLTVRDSNNIAIQSIYGGDGFASSSLQKMPVNLRSPNKDDTLNPVDIHQLAKTLNSQLGFNKVQVITGGDKFWY